MYTISNVYLIAAIAVVGGMLFGFDIASMSAIIPATSYKCYFNEAPFFDDAGNCLGPKSSTQGGISAAMPGGSWLGSLVSGYLTDRLGRKWAIGIGCVLWWVILCILGEREGYLADGGRVIGSAVTASSQNIGQLCAGRVINGICVGIASAQVPVYITELAPPTKRGRLVGLQQWAITWGIMSKCGKTIACPLRTHITVSAQLAD